MAALKFLTEIASPYTKILITRSQLPISAEIMRQLASRKSIFLTPLPDPSTSNLPSDNYGVVIHFVGFEKESLAETIYHTTTLHKLMDLCLSKRGKFILVTPDSPSPLRDTAINLVSQFGKNFKLDYRIVSLHPGYGLKVTATQIINLFIKNFQPPPPRLDTDPFVSPVVAKLAAKPKTRRWWLLGLVLLPWVMYVLLVGIWQASLLCTWNTWSQSTGGINCPVILNKATEALLFQQKWLPAVPDIERQLVASQQIARTSQGLNRVKHLESQLLIALVDPTRDIIDLKESVQTDWIKVAQENIAAFESTRIYPQWTAPLKAAKNKLYQWDNISRDIPFLFSVGRSSKVAILVQDSWQSRPSGGVVDTTVIVPINNGQVADMQLYTSDQLDSLLRGQVVPPEDFKKATGENDWYLRDVGWMVAFPEVAQKAAWFINKELGQPVDIVIAINSETLLQIVDALGGVTVNGSQVTKENFAESRISYVPDGPSSSFIKDLTGQILKKIPQSEKSQWESLLNVWSTSLNSRNSFVYSINPELTSLRANKWDGNISLPSCQTINCLNSSIYVSNSNVGMNSANRWTSSKYLANINIAEEDIKTTYSLKYTNNSANSPEVLKNYVRLNLSGTHEVVGVRIDNRQLKPDAVSQSMEKGYTVIGVTVTIPAGATVPIEIDTRQRITDLANFQLNWYNQPGESNTSIQVKITLPSEWKVSNSTPAAVASGGAIEYNSSLRAPYQVNLTFTHGR
jgi:hypothetical protein